MNPADHASVEIGFKFVNVYDNGSGPANKYVSFTDAELAMRIVYEEN